MRRAMQGPLHDLRLLYLAHRIEEAFEGLEKAMERHLPAGPVRDTLRPLFEGGPGHRRLEQSLDRLNRDVEAQGGLSVDEILEALLECERLAEGFYRGHAGEMSDPALGALFRDLAKEEGLHALAVQTAMSIQASRR